MPMVSPSGTTPPYDLATDVDTAGYFNTACDMLRVGDMIMSNIDTDGSPQAGI